MRKLLNLSEPPFPLCKTEIITVASSVSSLWGLNETVHTELAVLGLRIPAKNDFKLCFSGRVTPHPGFQPLTTLVGHKAPRLTPTPPPFTGQLRNPGVQSCSRYRIKLELELG